jgi:hypothetical protein
MEVRGLLGDKPIRVMSYPLVTVLAEKFESTVALGSVNSRMKDFYDIWFMLEHMTFPNEEISSALRATFGRRKTEMPEFPAVFSSTFANSETVLKLWKGFIRRAHLGDIVFVNVYNVIKSRMEPIYHEVRNRRR